jgi:hypothetical protein
MKSFYQEWLRKNNEENIAAQPTNTPSSSAVQNPLVADVLATKRATSPTLAMAGSPVPSTSTDAIPKQTDIVFENDKFKLHVLKEAFMRQKNFNLQDHLFHIKIDLKNVGDKPYLKDILDFLEKGLLFIVDNIKKHYNEDDANLCFLTLYQQPMVNGLNSGILLLIFIISFLCTLLVDYQIGFNYLAYLLPTLKRVLNSLLISTSNQTSLVQ